MCCFFLLSSSPNFNSWTRHTHTASTMQKWPIDSFVYVSSIILIDLLVPNGTCVTTQKKVYKYKWKLQQYASWGVNAHGAHNKIVHSWNKRVSRGKTGERRRTYGMLLPIAREVLTWSVWTKIEFRLNFGKNTNSIFGKQIDFRRTLTEFMFLFVLHSPKRIGLKVT